MAPPRWIALGALVALACGGPDGGADAATPRDAGETPDASAGRDAGPPMDAGPPSDGGAPAPWRTEPPLPEAVQEISVVAHQGRIVLAGGFEGGAVVATVRVFDPATAQWSELPAMPAPRHHMTLVSFDDALYALGGMQTSAFAPLDTAWVLRDGGAAWEDIAPLPEDRGAAAGDRVGAQIVLAGGNQSRGGLASRTLVYEPASDTWSVGAAIPTEREHLAAVGFGSELYVMAGRLNSLSTNLATLEVYDPAADTWRSGPDLGVARGGFDAALLGEAIVLVGGEQPDRALDSVERFDLATETWSLLEPVPTPRHGHGVAAIGGRLYVVGGADRPIFAAVDVVESFAP